MAQDMPDSKFTPMSPKLIISLCPYILNSPPTISD